MKQALVFLPLVLLAGTAMAATQIVATLDAPDTNITGLGFGNGSLWAVDHDTEFAYRVNPATGAVEHSWYCSNSTQVPSGLTYANGTIYISMGNPPNLTSSYAYRYNESGVYQGQFDLDC